ncbi:MAG: chemotaxis protein CheX [Candidatus Cloacimonetes bacterium]|nr:chemotaxis protein CheX [Candidatus Cloacimonadota bacterium]
MIQNLKDLTSNILETMFYLTEETEPIQKEQNFKYAVCIKDEKLDMILMFSGRTAVTMTENFLGTDDITDADIVDTLKEAINIITGNFIRISMNDQNAKINIPFMIDNISSIKTESYQTAMLFYKEEPLSILLKVG